MFSNKLLDITWNISISLLYLIIIIYSVNYLNPELGTTIKGFINKLLNVDSNNLISNTVSNLKVFNTNDLYDKMTINPFNRNNRKLVD